MADSHTEPTRHEPYDEIPRFDDTEHLDRYLRVVFEAILLSEDLAPEDARDCLRRFAHEVDHAVKAGAVGCVVNGNGYRFPIRDTDYDTRTDPSTDT